MGSFGDQTASLAMMREKGRFAPKPTTWDGYSPGPLILSVHWSTTAQRKHEQLVEQLEWARRHGRFANALDYLKGLEADAWSPLPHELWPDQSG
jgi:hypothetical protein